MTLNMSPFGPVQKWSGVREHRLNAPCSCGHAKWLHDHRCVAVKPGDGHRVVPCSCEFTKEDFA